MFVKKFRFVESMSTAESIKNEKIKTRDERINERFEFKLLINRKRVVLKTFDTTK